MPDYGLSEHGYPLIMACDHVLNQGRKPVTCDYSPPDYICEECHTQMEKHMETTDEKMMAEVVKFTHLYCSDCIKKKMLN